MDVYVIATPIVTLVAVALLALLNHRHPRPETRRSLVGYGLLGMPSTVDLVDRKVDGLHVRVWTDKDNNRTHLRTAIPAPIPDNVRIHPENIAHELLEAIGEEDVHLGKALLDRMLRIDGPDEAKVRHWLSDPELAFHLRGLLEREVRIEAEGSKLQLWVHGPPRDGPEDFSKRGLRLARLLARSWDGPWRAFAERGGHSFSGQGSRPRTVSGSLDDCSFTLEILQIGSKAFTRVHVPIEARLPSGLRVTLRSAGDDGGIELADPVLARLVRIDCDDPDAARRLVAGDAIREHLLAVVHGHPGSELHSEAVVLVVPGHSLDPEPLVAEATGLAHVLGRDQDSRK